MVIRQGDVFWVDFGEPHGSRPAYRRPSIVIQNNLFNASRISTVVVCALTSNVELAQAPGNVLLSEGEANLPKMSVANVSQVFTVDKRDLAEKIGSLSPRRVRQVVDGLMLLLEPANADL